MITIVQAILLGALQGITEFLPVSSSGHLVVVQQLFDWHADNAILLAFDVALHVGTLFAVVAVFWRDVVDMLTGRGWKLMGLLIVATMPAVVIGLGVKDIIEAMFSSVMVVGVAWLVTGTFLWATKFIKERDGNSERPVTWPKALFIGCVQAFAIIPGISRSGSTICAGLFAKLDRKAAAKFAFLMSIPAIAGGAILDAKDILGFPKEGMAQLFLGVLVSFVVGYLSIKWLLSIIQHGKLWYFGIYCWIIGLATVLYCTIF